jgi:hypothetical protein
MESLEDAFMEFINGKSASTLRIQNVAKIAVSQQVRFLPCSTLNV